MFDLENNFEVSSRKRQNLDGLYYIDEQQDFQPTPLAEFEHKGV